MATGATLNDREFLFRLQTLVIDGGTLVIRSIFDQRVCISNLPLNVFLASEKTTINRLRAQKTITRTHYDQMFPPSGQPPNSADFDITIIICLLRNLQSLGLNPNYTWNTAPQPTDTSVEDDLFRLKGFRNEIAHISTTTGFNQTSFQSKWTDIENVLSRLNSAVPNPIPAFQQMIDSYKHIPLDPAAERRIQTYIEQWRKLEKGLDIDMQLMKKDFNEIKHDVKDITKDVKEMKEFEQAVKELKEHTEIQARDICDMKEDVTTITKQEKEVHKNVEEVKLDVKDINRNIVLMSKDIETVKENVTVVKGVTRDINTVKEHVGEVKKRFDEVKGTITKVEDGVSEVKGHFIKVTEDVNMVRELLKEHIENQKVVSNTKIQQTPGKVRQALKIIFRVGKSKLKNEKGVQDDLIAFYRRQYTNISLCPLVEEETPLLKFYVTPDILSIKVHRARGGGIEIKTRVAPFGDMFYNNITDDLYHEIYLTADAGLGKTAFCKRLALTWCQAKKPLKSENQYFSKEEIEALRGFRFVFLLLLRDSSSECDIDALIFTQIISQLSHNYTMIDLENILTKETCLVILDGLDEWSHP